MMPWACKIDLDKYKLLASLIKNSPDFSLKKQIQRCNRLKRIVPEGLHPSVRYRTSSGFK